MTRSALKEFKTLLTVQFTRSAESRFGIDREYLVFDRFPAFFTNSIFARLDLPKCDIDFVQAIFKILRRSKLIPYLLRFITLFISMINIIPKIDWALVSRYLSRN
jgi:hypothetical protein